MSAIKNCMLLYIISALFLNSTNCVFYYMEVRKHYFPILKKNESSAKVREGELEQQTQVNMTSLYIYAELKKYCWISYKSYCENIQPVWRNTGSLLSPTSGCLCSMCSARPLHYSQQRPSTCQLRSLSQESRMMGSVDEGRYSHRWLGDSLTLADREETERYKLSEENGDQQLVGLQGKDHSRHF